MSTDSYRGYTPEQGDIVYVTFDPQSDREIKKRRPALVVSATPYNRATGFVQICPITSTIRHRPGFFTLTDQKAVSGQVNAIQLRSVDFLSSHKNIVKVEAIDPRTFGEIAQFIRFIFDFDQILDFGD